MEVHVIHVNSIIAFDKLALYVTRYNYKKGFYCKVLNNSRTKCLGTSKGRHYPPMESNAASFLTDYYRYAESDLYQSLEYTYLFFHY